jgi:hypothetical protein
MNNGGIKDNPHIFKCLDVSTAHITERETMSCSRKRTLP